MRDDLVRYHGIATERVAVTGWPQTDVFHRRRPRAAYEELLAGMGLDPFRPLVLVMGNTPTNAPFEQNLVERLVGWWSESGAGALLAAAPPASERPPLARALRGRAGPAGAHVQEPSYTIWSRSRRCSSTATAWSRTRDDPARQPRQRPACRLRALRRRCAAGRAVGVAEHRWRALPRAHGVRAPSTGPTASRTSSTASSGRSSSRRSSPRAGPRRASRRRRGGRPRRGACRRGDPRRHRRLAASCSSPTVPSSTNAGATGSTKCRSAAGRPR